jgi:hypothetical protein
MERHRYCRTTIRTHPLLHHICWRLPANMTGSSICHGFVVVLFIGIGDQHVRCKVLAPPQGQFPALRRLKAPLCVSLAPVHAPALRAYNAAAFGHKARKRRRTANGGRRDSQVRRSGVSGSGGQDGLAATVPNGRLVGLLISNTIGMPSWLRSAACTEFSIKTGLVLLGAEIIFGRLLDLGLPGNAFAVGRLAASWLAHRVSVRWLYPLVLFARSAAGRHCQAAGRHCQAAPPCLPSGTEGRSVPRSFAPDTSCPLGTAART